MSAVARSRAMRAAACAVLLAAACVGSPTGAQPTTSELDKARLDNERAQAKYYERQTGREPRRDWTPIASTALGGLLAMAGGFGGQFLTNWLMERKARREHAKTYRRQKSQLNLALDELATSLAKITDAFRTAQRPPPFLAERLIFDKYSRPDEGDRTHDYYLKHDLVSTVYRFCALLGWMELYRTDLSFLRSESEEQGEIEACFAGIRKILADACEGDEPAPVGECRRDGFVLEEDQRAIGEKMIAERRSDVVIGYAVFCETLFREPRSDDPTSPRYRKSQNWWVWNATRFFVELGKSGSAPDFRLERVKRLEKCIRKLKAVIAS